MIISGLISWWYLDGFKLFFLKLWAKLGDTADLFSIGSLLKTLFAPYRQISANASGVSIDDKFFAFIDRMVSRLVGGVARLGIITVGIIVLLIQLVGSIFSLMLWPLMPLAPILFVTLFVLGVTL
jgi:hypothetical protein